MTRPGSRNPEGSDYHHKTARPRPPKRALTSSDESPLGRDRDRGRVRPRVWTRCCYFLIIGVPLVYLGLMPLRPWMLVNAPVLQEFINGAKTAVVAAGPPTPASVRFRCGSSSLPDSYRNGETRLGLLVGQLTLGRRNSTALRPKRATDQTHRIPQADPELGLLPHDRRLALPGEYQEISSTSSPAGHGCGYRCSSSPTSWAA